MISRRQWLAQSAAFGVCWIAGCKTPPTRQSVLEALVEKQVVPELRALPAQCQALAEALAQLDQAPSAAQLETARSAFRKTLAVWSRAQTFRSGPLVEANVFLRAGFWPVRGSLLEQTIAGSGTLDAARVEALGVDAKGLFALERLLWERPAAAPEGWLVGDRAPRARTFARALSADVATRVSAAVAAMGDGRSFAQRFAAEGQASLARLLTQNVETIESIAVDRLSRVLALHEQKRLRLGEVQADFSGMSTQLCLEQLGSIAAMYRGAGSDQGVAALVRQAAPQVEPRIGSALDRALAALKDVKLPLEQAVVQNQPAVSVAHARVKDLEVAYKTELASALAITLSLVSGDGD